jgi:hypothetical protein
MRLLPLLALAAAAAACHGGPAENAAALDRESIRRQPGLSLAEAGRAQLPS